MKPQAHQHDQRVQCQTDGSSDRGLVEGRGQVQQAQEGHLQVETLTHHSSALSYVHHQGLLIVQEGDRKATCQTVYLCREEAKFDNRALKV